MKYFFHIRMWGLGLSLYVMLGTIVFIILLLVYMVGSVVFGQFRQLQKNQTKSMIHLSLTCPPWRHVVWINRFGSLQLSFCLESHVSLESWNSQSLMCTTTAPLVSYLNVDIWGMSKYKHIHYGFGGLVLVCIEADFASYLVT